MFFRKMSVALTVIITLVTVTTLVLGIFGFINYTSEKNERWTKLRAELSAAADQVSTGLTLPIWNIDRQQIDKVVETMMKNRDLYGIIVHAAGKNHIRVRDTLWNITGAKTEFQPTGLLTEERDITFLNESIGHVKLFSTTKFVEDELRGTLVSTISTILVLDLLLTLSLYLLLWRNVLKPLKQVEEYAVTVSSRGFNELTIRGTRFHGELEGLRSSIEKMVNLLDARYKELLEEMKQRRESEAHYRALVENTPDIIATFDREGRYLFINSAISGISPFKPKDFIGKRMNEVGFSAEQASFREKAIRSVFESRSSFETEFAYEDGKGNTTIYDWRVYPVLDTDGNVLSVFSISRNITERKRAQEALRLSEEKFSRAFKSSPDSITISRIKDGTFIEINDGFERITGLRRDEVIGKTAVELGIWGTNKQRVKLVEALRAQGSVRQMDFNFHVKEGEVRACQVSAEIVQIEGEECILGTTRDITERKQAEEEIKKSREQLRALAAHLQSVREEERTHIAREIHDELGQLLTGLKMDAAFIKEMVVENEQSSKNSEIENKLLSMTNLIDETIRSVRKISSELRPAILDSLGIIAAIEWYTEEFQKRTNIRCHCITPEDNIKFDQVHSTTLYRILQESLTNVVRHSQATEVTVTLSIGAGNITLLVNDNGTGISAHDMYKLNSFGILGMKERAVLLGGSVEIQGTPRAGTTVTLKIPWS